VGCEFSQVVTNGFRKRGHDAWSCDTLPTEGDPRYHLQCDVREVLHDGWDLAIFHPDCKRLCNAGVRWLTTEPNRFIEMYQDAQFFKELLNAPIDKICIENSKPHGYALVAIKQKFDQIVQPWQHGHPESKGVCLWLKNLSPLEETNNVREYMMTLPKKERTRVHYAAPGPDRWKERARFFPGIAAAMAEQWGVL